MVLYLTPFILILGCGFWYWMRRKAAQYWTKGVNEDDDNEMTILVLGFVFIFTAYILSILSVSTMVRIYDGQGYGQSVWDAMGERTSGDYFERKLAGLYDAESQIE